MQIKCNLVDVTDRLYSYHIVQLNKSKVPELKEMCKALGLPVSGTKQVLIDRIMEACS